MVGYGGADGTGRLDVRRAGLALVGVLSMGLLWSCGGSSTHRGEPAPSPVSEGEFAQKVADAVCGNLGDCCASAGIPYDRAGCEAFVLEELELEALPNATWDSVEAGRCVDWFARVASSCFEVEARDEACTGPYRGTLPEGAACVDSVQCADIGGSAATCAYDDSFMSRTCAREMAPARGRAGATCNGTCDFSSCIVSAGPAEVAYTLCYVEDGLVCGSTSGVCEPPPVVGEPCYDFYCAAGAYCSNLELTCQPSRPDGEPCENDQECSGGWCADDNLCRQRTIASPELCSGQ